jgi:hypothetical protein
MRHTLVLLLTALAAGESPHAETQPKVKPLRFTTSWVGNTFGGGSKWVQNAAESMQVLLDGTFTWARPWLGLGPGR